MQLLALIAFVLLCLQVTAQRPGYQYPEWARKRFFSVSTASPMLNHMIRQPGFNQSVSVLIDFVNSVETEIMNSLRNQSLPDRGMLFQPCRVNVDNVYTVRQSFAQRGLPEIVNDCTTDVIDTQFYEDERPAYSIDTIFDATSRFFLLAAREKNRLFDKTLRLWPPLKEIGYDWNQIDDNSHIPVKKDNIQCFASLTGMNRVNNKWYVVLALTNTPSTHTPPAFQRQNIRESMHIDITEGIALSLKSIIPEYTAEPLDGPPVNGTTTIFTRWKWRKTLGQFDGMSSLDNPAVQSSLGKAKLQSEQASSSMLLSNLLILFLPVGLNLVPLALIVEVERKVLLLTLLSDIITVVPLAIKGIELIVISKQRFRSVATRIHNDMRGVRGQAAAGEFWTVECKVQQNVFPAGVVLVCMAVVMLVFGMWLELWAARFVRERNTRRLQLKLMYEKIRADEKYDDEAYVASLCRGSVRLHESGLTVLSKAR